MIKEVGDVLQASQTPMADAMPLTPYPFLSAVLTCPWMLFLLLFMLL